MLQFAAYQRELDKVVPVSVATKARQVSQRSLPELRKEKERLSEALMQIHGLLVGIPWANWKPIYNEIGARLEFVKTEKSNRME